MTIKVALTHVTTYRYDRLVRLGAQTVRLRPAPHSRTRVPSYALKVEPGQHFLNWQQDPQGNWLARLVFPERTREFRIAVDLIADIEAVNPFDFFLEEEAETWPFPYDPVLARELAPFLETEPVGPHLAAHLAGIERKRIHCVDFLVEINRRLEQEIQYLIRMEPGIQTTEETLARKSGSCRDTAWLLVQILRNLGLAARFVSGYLIQLKPDVKPLDGPAGASEDFTDLHAWAEVYLPGAGWIGLDPTSGLFTAEGHIPLAATPDPKSAAPLSGLMSAAEVTFDFEMHIARISETPRVTKPYTESQWTAIEALGHQVDARLRANDVRLTMGGEPTFVAQEDPEAPEWTTAAVGPSKQAYADDLIRRLRDAFAPNGLLQFGQGKWYPGESLPRWAYALYWRSDGEPLWQNPDLADSLGHKTGASSLSEAGELARGIATALGVDPDCVLPAFEDPGHALLKEAQLPENVSVLDSKLEDPEERARLTHIFERGITQPVGFVLPVQRWQSRAREGWISERWTFRRKRLFLMPGDSPIGFRLPLGGLPYLTSAQFPYYQPTDPFAVQPPLPQPQPIQRRTLDPTRRALPQLEDWMRPIENAGGGDGPEYVRTALAVELRDGRIHVFLPPTANSTDFVDLVHAVESAAAAIPAPVVLEGYGPPPDDRLNVIKVTPDPGVIEVNIHPASGWDALVANTQTLYEAARETRLGTEKFMVDGRHTGTGGGNHLVLGGATPEDSPFLRRPDLLRSLIGYWQNHPSLSYLFSGLFIGPTSQAPRIDEARLDQLHEMELAFRQIPDDAENLPYWLVDRVFRNLLIDVTGNTHRAEICIDKLYSPDGPTGRLGLVEFRAFEMPPHARMSLAQQLLLRALIARFWTEPYKKPLIRWGSALHDRFMLPFFAWEDFRAVIRELNEAGFPLEEAWFQPHFEFKFPRFGTLEIGGTLVELRQALEPWHVMGEEGMAGGTVRYVDSSLERLQIRAEGLQPGRHAIACNGQPLPLTPTGRVGEAVAGVRFRAWAPPSALHPTLPADGPLVFDVVDLWNARSLGGFTYHVSHPGGRAYDTLPVNALEAEARRKSRFIEHGHSIGTISLPEASRSREYPMTLDLRWRHVPRG